MKKFLTLMAFLLIVLLVILEIVLPRTVENLLQEQIAKSTAAQEIDIDLSSSPNAKIALGEIDKIHAAARQGRIGEIDFTNLSLEGEKIQLDMKEILFPSAELSDKERADKILKSVDKLELHGVIGEEDLKSFVARKVDKLENAEIKITAQEISAKGQVKIMGRTADIDLAGIFLVDNGNIYFQATRLNVKNALLRHVNLDRFLGELKILDRESLPPNLKFDEVELRDGEILYSIRKEK
mgnify:CR=1 FL=1